MPNRIRFTPATAGLILILALVVAIALLVGFSLLVAWLITLLVPTSDLWVTFWLVLFATTLIRLVVVNSPRRR